VAADLVTLTIGQLVGDASIGRIPLELILTAAMLNAGLTALLLYPARVAAARWLPDESPAW
jgi:hypothetical protein